MQKFLILLFTMAFLGCSPTSPTSPISSGFYVGTKRGIVSYRYILLVNDSIATLESYRDFKGEILAFDLAKNSVVLDYASPLRLMILNSNDHYLLKDSVDLCLQAVCKDNMITIKEPIKASLKWTSVLTREYKNTRNLAMYYLAYHCPEAILGHKLNSNSERDYFLAFNNRDLKNKCSELEYDEYLVFLKRTFSAYE